MADPRRKPVAGPEQVSKALAEYKTILRRVLDSRPSGTRQRLAEALGKNRSFISQISNPAYSTPIPASTSNTSSNCATFRPARRRRSWTR